MTHDMKKTLTRLFTVALLMMVSMGAEADVKVLFGENGDDVFSGKGGTIEVSQEPDEKDETKVIVTLTVTPKKNYSISKDDIKVYAVFPASVRSTRGLEISNELTLDGKAPQNLSEKREYTVTLDASLGLWVKEANFMNMRKEEGDIVVTYHIINMGRLDNSGQLTSTRTEALRFTVTGESVTVGLPAQYKSPLAKNWVYYSSDEVTFNASTKECTITGTPSLTEDVSVLTTDADVYVTYEFNEAALTTVGLADGGIYNIKLADNKYLYQNTWQGDPNTATETTSDPTAAKYLWKLNIIDPYQITIQSKSSSYTDYFLTAKVGAYADIRLRNTLSTAKENKVWAFALIPGGAANTYRLIIADGYTYAAGVDCDEFKHGYLNNNDNGKSRYHLYYKNNTYQKCDLTFQALTKTFTYKIIDKQGRIAIQSSPQTQPVGKLSGYENIPEEVRSPYIVDEEVSFYTFSGDYSSDNLSDENQITEMPLTDATIYVTYTTDHLLEKALKLRGARAFNITADGGYIHDGESGNANSPNYMWFFTGGDPYAVIVKNAETSNYLAFTTPLTTPPTLSIDNAPYKFILMSGSSSDDEQQIILMPASGGTDYTSIEVTASPVSVSSNYYLIDKAGKLIVGPLPSTSQELALPTEWVSPLVSEYHYFKASGYDDGTDTYSPTNEIYNPVEVGTDGDIYVTYDVSDVIDLSGTNSYLLKFSGGEEFHQEDGHDGINKVGYTDYGVTEATKAVYPYNNGDFNLYVYGQEQWVKQLSDGASTRTRWLWKFVSANTDPYHVLVKSHQDHVVKDKDLDDNTKDKNYGEGHSYLQTYKPSDYASVITNIAYENVPYSEAYPAKMMVNGQPTSMVNGQPTEYMILGTSLLSMTLKTFNEVEGERRIVDSFEQYWKNNPTVETLVNATNPAADNATLTGMGWHQFTSWAYSAPWGGGSKALAEGKHWYQTISMGSEFTVEEVSLEPQVILLDQHGWEVMRVPLSDTETLRKYDSPMVQTYHWYPTAEKVSGYHKYRVSNQNIPVYNSDRKVIEGQYFTHNSTTLAYTPYDYFEKIMDEHGWGTQDDRVKTDFYVTYEVKSDYAKSYKGAATADATSASAFILEQDGKYAKIASPTSTSMTLETSKPANTEDTPDDMLWNLKPNFNIDREMGYKYAGEAGAQSDAESKDATEAKYMQNGQNGFDPYNVQIQSKAYPQRYFTANTSGSALDGGVWKGSSSSVTLQNMTTTSRQTAAGYDQTTLNITNATFMVVDDGSGNMRLMPRFDHQKVMTSFTSLAEPSASVDATQTFDVETIAKAKLIYSSDEIDTDDMTASYILAPGFTFTSSFTSLGTSTDPFKGTIDGQLNAISGLGVPLVAYAKDAIIRNVILEGVQISQAGPVGAIAGTASGYTRIYNCGILPTDNKYVAKDETSYVESTGNSAEDVTDSYCGGLVGWLKEDSRVINCFSYANITGGAEVAGIVGYNSYASTTTKTESNTKYGNLKTMVMNCMFYGDITGGGTSRPVYGGLKIDNNQDNGINNYNYYRANRYEYNKNKGEYENIDDVTFDDAYAIGDYYCSWPAEAQYLTRYEYYRSILNANRPLAGWWVKSDVAPSTMAVADVQAIEKDASLMAKWVVNPKIAPYPILKSLDKYPSIVNPDPDNVWNAEKNDWISRKTEAKPYEGKNLGSINVTVKGGDFSNSVTISDLELQVLDMDTLNHDYCYAKVQLPYYNEIFGDPTGDTWVKKYANNYTTKVVTGWNITSATGEGATPGSFKGVEVIKGTSSSTPDVTTGNPWEDGYNFADRKCTNKDIFSKSGRVFAQGGYYYVPIGVTDITIEAHWAAARYVCNADNSYDRVKVGGKHFEPAGTIPTSFQGQKVFSSIKSAIETAASTTTDANVQAYGTVTTKTVYDQAIVLLGSMQLNNGNTRYGKYGDNAIPFTLMSVDLDFDNEPDNCLDLQFRNNLDRPGIQPIRFDFLPIPDLGLAVRVDKKGYSIGIMVPYGHFEITETAFMHTTQFEYDGPDKLDRKMLSPVILNGGHFEQFVARYGGRKTEYIVMGGHFRMRRFTPGDHTKGNQKNTRHCAVSVMGGEFPEFYLSGYYRTDVNPTADNPHCYVNGGRFGTMAGACVEKVNGSVTFQIDHAIIDEFYGGGTNAINSLNTITGSIDVTINNSIVGEYYGGPQVGDMGKDKTITTHANGTTFRTFFGGGRGGTSFFREEKFDDDVAMPTSTSDWNGWGSFKPLKTYDGSKGYHALYEFELFNSSNGLDENVVKRAYYRWARFAKTQTGAITNVLTNCTLLGDFYAAGNLAAVGGTTETGVNLGNCNVESTLTNTTVKGSVFGAGFSAAIPSFLVHDNSNSHFHIPERSEAGVIKDGWVDYQEDGDVENDGSVYKYYRWTHSNDDLPTGVTMPSNISESNSTFKGSDNKYYCYTPQTLTGLGSVTGNVILTIKGSSKIGTILDNGNLKANTGHVYGGGDESAVTGSTTVNLEGSTEVFGNVFGGGNEGLVNGSATVNIRPETPTNNTGSGTGTGEGSGSGSGGN